MLFQGCKIESTKKARCKLKITNLDAHFTSLIIRTCSTNPRIISYWCTSKICTGKMVPGITLIACYPVYIFHGILAFTTHAIIFRFWSGSEKILKRFWKDFQRETIILTCTNECVVHVCTFSCYWIRYSLWRDCLPGCNAVTLLLPLLKRLKQLLNQMIVFYIIICDRPRENESSRRLRKFFRACIKRKRRVYKRIVHNYSLFLRARACPTR